MEFDKLVDFAKKNRLNSYRGYDDLVVGGIVDKLEEAGLRVFGPRKNAAILEGSKLLKRLNEEI